MYLIKRDDGKYVAVRDSKHSYTTRVDLARVYQTKEEAEQDLCHENERIVPIPNLFNR